MQQTFDFAGVRMTRPIVEAAIDRYLEVGNFEMADLLLAMLDDADGGEHDGREPDDGDYEWDGRNGDKPPVDPAGFDIVQDREWAMTAGCGHPVYRDDA